MTAFAIAAIAMVLLACVLLAVPLLRRSTGQVPDAVQVPRALGAGVAVLISVPLAAALLYAYSSDHNWFAPPGAAVASDPALALADATRQLADRLESEPQDLEGWRMLARTYIVTGQPQRAVDALEHAIGLNPSAAMTLQLDLGEALVLTGTEAGVARARDIFDASLAAQPQEQKALWYSGVIALGEGDRATALQRWSVLRQLPLEPQVRQLVDAQLQELGVPGADAGADDGAQPAASASARRIFVRVAVAPTLAARVGKNATLFVSAREPGIPGPPLAVARLTSGALPTTVELSDASAMIAGRTLSSVDAVQVTARVAFGGTAQTVSGDLFGTALHRRDDAAELAITIDQVAP